MAGFTKGKWLIDNNVIYALNRYGENRFSCYVQPGKDDDKFCTSALELKANARLIAAAPEMYEALKECLALLDKQRKEIDNDR